MWALIAGCVIVVLLAGLFAPKPEPFQPPLVVTPVACQWGEQQEITCRATYDTLRLQQGEVVFVPLVWHLGALTKIDSVAASKRCTWRDHIREGS